MSVVVVTPSGDELQLHDRVNASTSVAVLRDAVCMSEKVPRDVGSPLLQVRPFDKNAANVPNEATLAAVGATDGSVFYTV